MPGCSGVEIIYPDGTAVPLDRRSPVRQLPAYSRIVRRKEEDDGPERRRRRRVPDELLRGKILDILG